MLVGIAENRRLPGLVRHFLLDVPFGLLPRLLLFRFHYLFLCLRFGGFGFLLCKGLLCQLRLFPGFLLGLPLCIPFGLPCSVAFEARFLFVRYATRALFRFFLGLCLGFQPGSFPGFPLRLLLRLRFGCKSGFLFGFPARLFFRFLSYLRFRLYTRPLICLPLRLLLGIAPGLLFRVTARLFFGFLPRLLLGLQSRLFLGFLLGPLFAVAFEFLDRLTADLRHRCFAARFFFRFLPYSFLGFQLRLRLGL